MRKFITRLITFSIYFLLVAVSLIALYFYIQKITYQDIPALNFSNSYSFNEKIRFLKNSSKEPNIIAVGSSMCLNNLYSNTVIKEFKSDKFLNTASWGMSMHDDYLFI